jgi:hypothetical protein
MTRKTTRNQSYGQTSALEKSPERRGREAAARKRQKKRWARKSGPVTVRFQCPHGGGDHSRSDCPSESSGG